MADLFVGDFYEEKTFVSSGCDRCDHPIVRDFLSSGQCYQIWMLGMCGDNGPRPWRWSRMGR